MNRSSLLRSVLVLAATTSWSCGGTDDVAPDTLNFNRPTDIAFACYGGLRITNGSASSVDQQVTNSAQPLQSCDIRSQAYDTSATPPVPPGQENLGSGSDASEVPVVGWYSFILQSVPGTVGIATWATKPSSSFSGGGDVTVLDADPLTPGKSGITMGQDPVGLVTDQIGCYEITANNGSCDLSALDITSALSYQADPKDALANNQPVRVSRLSLVNGAGIPMRAKPAAIVSEPAAGTIGFACPATPTGLVYVAYPGCHLVAGIDTATGTVVTGIQFDANGTPTIVDGTVTCPDECSGGAQTTAGPRPTSLDLQLDPRSARRALAIGSENSNVVTIVDLDINSLPTSTSNVLLEDKKGNLGVNAVRISPEIGMGGEQGVILDDGAPGGQMQFVYAITSDATIRVANILASNPIGITECDTQVDPRYLHDQKEIPFLSCMPVGGVAGEPGRIITTPPRRATAIGPGIQLQNRMPANTATTVIDPTTGAAASPINGTTAALTIPMGIDIFEIQPVALNTDAPGTPDRMIGYFGIITGANGLTYVLNVDNDDYFDDVNSLNPIGSAIPYDIANQVRDGLPARNLLAEEQVGSGEQPFCDTDGPDPDSTSGNAGGPRSVLSIVQTLPTDIIAPDKSIEMPSIRQVRCIGIDEADGAAVSEMSFAAPVSVRDAEYPDVMGMISDETWLLTWEGSVSVDTLDTASNGPADRTSMMQVNGDGFFMVDQTQPFCDAGIQPWDIVQVEGCNPSLGNSDCPIGYDCFVHPDSQVVGIGACMLSTEADRLSNACKEYLVSQRRYTIGTTASGTIQLLPRKHVLRTSPINGCVDDAQCATLANYALDNNSPNNPSDDTPPVDTHAWTCMLDTQRAPELDDSGNPLKRCVETCAQDSDCDPTNVCDTNTGLCMEGVVPPQSCVNAPQKYELRVGEAFAVQGTLSGFHHQIIADANGTCITDPTASPFKIGRLPLRAPPCDPTANALGILPDGTVEANPCETTVTQTETENQYVPGTCTPATPATALVDRPADAIVFRNQALNLTLVDPTYPGDATCIGDRGGGLGKIPLVPPLTQYSERVTGGFIPQFLDIQPALPGKVVRGPTNSIWVIDTGDYLSIDVDIASTSGKVYRIESQSIGIINLLE
jgi:hypothetical protein